MDSSQSAASLLTEHLQYTPLSLIDDVIDSVNNLVYQGVGSLETGLFATPPERLGFKALLKNSESTATTDVEYPEAKQEIEEGLHKLETLLNSTIDKNFDKLEIYVLRNILSVPKDLVNWIQLAHYDGIEYPLPADTPTNESITLLRQKLAASRRLNRALLMEKRRNDILLEQLRSITQPSDENSQTPNFSFLNNDRIAPIFGTQSQRPLTTNTTFTISQLPAMKQVLADLRVQLTTLRDTPMRTDTAKEELREERREYIEQRTRSHLQQQGHVADEDAGVVSGRKIDPAEIDALEKIVESLNQT